MSRAKFGQFLKFNSPINYYEINTFFTIRVFFKIINLDCIIRAYLSSFNILISIPTENINNMCRFECDILLKICIFDLIISSEFETLDCPSCWDCDGMSASLFAIFICFSPVSY